MINQDKHPCFGDTLHQYARIHIPIAPKCNIKCKYCVRKYSCMNESRPGVTNKVLTPEQGIIEVKNAMEKYGDKLSVVGIAGPGDSLANIDRVKEFYSKLPKKKGIDYCISTNGLEISAKIETILSLNIHYVTITINAITAETASNIYEYITLGNEIIRGKEAARILLERQWRGLELLCKEGVVCKVNTIAIKGVNNHEVTEIMKKAANYGAAIGNITRLIPLAGSGFCTDNVLEHDEICNLRHTAETYLKQSWHCKQCRADAVGFL